MLVFLSPRRGRKRETQRLHDLRERWLKLSEIVVDKLSVAFDPLPAWRSPYCCQGSSSRRLPVHYVFIPFSLRAEEAVTARSEPEK